MFLTVRKIVFLFLKTLLTLVAIPKIWGGIFLKLFCRLFYSFILKSFFNDFHLDKTLNSQDQATVLKVIWQVHSITVALIPPTRAALNTCPVVFHQKKKKFLGTGLYSFGHNSNSVFSDFVVLFFLIYFYWSMVDLQCVSFCCVAKWISYTDFPLSYILFSYTLLQSTE